MARRHPEKYLGAHLSASGGVELVPERASAIGARAFSLFVKSQRQWFAPPAGEKSTALFGQAMAKTGISRDMVMPHAGYLINLASPDDEARERSIASFKCEIERCAAYGIGMVNIHPGSFLGKGSRHDAVRRVADSINRILSGTEGVKIVVESTAGQGSYLGAGFDELGAITAAVADKERIGVCLDTAHMYGAGFDISSEDGWNRAMDEFGSAVGFGRLCGAHLNDTAVKLASSVDRHAPIGEGNLGWKTFSFLMNDPRFDGIPLILETPDPARWAEEISRLEEL